MPHKDTEEAIENMVRDFGSVVPVPKSEIRSRLRSLIADTRTKTLEEVEAVLPKARRVAGHYNETENAVSMLGYGKTYGWDNYRTEALSAIEGLKK